jgi:hypothetical protein
MVAPPSFPGVSLHVGCQSRVALSGTVLEKQNPRKEVSLFHYKEVSMVDRDNRTKQGGQGSSQGPGRKSQGQGGRPGQTGQSGHETEGRPGQSKQTQGNPDQRRDEQGHFTGGSEQQGSRGKSGSGSGSSSDVEEEENDE